MAPQHLAVATRVAGDRDLHRLALSGASVVDAASVLWTDIEGFAG
jgi:hypothetical protein